AKNLGVPEAINTTSPEKLIQACKTPVESRIIELGLKFRKREISKEELRKLSELILSKRSHSRFLKEWGLEQTDG
ncbi:MAG: hypothetical protein JXB14_04155, partial [Candidatus Altiarchaeota archaeon]|nr:hypothetical protein [Candidatus Altiarchaeota archaeon]